MKVAIIFFPGKKREKILKMNGPLASEIESQGYHPDELTAWKVGKKLSIGK